MKKPGTIERFYQDAPKPAKGVFLIAATLLTVGGAWYLYRTIKQARDYNQANQAGAAASGEITRQEQTGARRTLSDTTISNMVAALVQAMNGCGTDEQAIYNTFEKCANDLDVLYLIKSFGVQYYEPCWITQADAYAVYLFNEKAYGGDLPTWLSYDLTSSEISKINAIFARKGITITF